MGAFGVGPFENDASIDWLAENAAGDVGSAIDAAFRECNQKSNRQIGATTGSIAVAAAALLAAAMTRDAHVVAFLEQLGLSVEDVAAAISTQRLKAARAATAIVASHKSQLCNEWDDSGLHNEWQSQLHTINTVLATADPEGP